MQEQKEKKPQRHKAHEEDEAGQGQPDNRLALLISLVVIAVLFGAYNTYEIKQVKIGSSPVNTVLGPRAAAPQASLGSIDVIPKGIPDVYGKELGVSFDDVSASSPERADATIRKLGTLDQTITLTGDDLQRYISIASLISCEYCCGAPAIITSDGKPACGCAHSYAMRGLAKYLIKYHIDGYTNDQILEEMGKWKTLFFPGPISKKAEILQQKGVALNYINLASNKYRGIEKGSGAGGMVGGC